MPVSSSRWMCSCGCVWNTFETGGVCPDCGKAWTDTQCLACHGWSRHQAWYHDFVDDTERLGEVETEPAPHPTHDS